MRLKADYSCWETDPSTRFSLTGGKNHLVSLESDRGDIRNDYSDGVGRMWPPHDTQTDSHSAAIVQPPPSSSESIISTKSGRIKTILLYLCQAAASSDKQPHWFTVSVTEMHFDFKTLWSAVFMWLSFSGATYQTCIVQLHPDIKLHSQSALDSKYSTFSPMLDKNICYK